MEIILKQDVAKLGFRNEIVTVKNGYGRNFLIPKGLGILATESAKKVLAENVKQRDLFQAIWRMRELSKGQTLELVLNKKFKEKSEKENPNIYDVLRVVKENEDKQVLAQTVQASQSQFSHLKRNHDFSDLIDT